MSIPANPTNKVAKEVKKITGVFWYAANIKNTYTKTILKNRKINKEIHIFFQSKTSSSVLNKIISKNDEVFCFISILFGDFHENSDFTEPIILFIFIRFFSFRFSPTNWEMKLTTWLSMSNVKKQEMKICHLDKLQKINTALSGPML